MNMESLTELKPNLNIPTFDSGDTVKVSTRVVEGERVRTQVFQGVVIRIRNSGAGSSFTVRRVTYGVGVERTFPIYSPNVEKVEVVRRGKTRRAKLYYLRGLSAKASRIKERRLSPQELAREQEEARNLAEQRAQLEREKAAAEQAEQPEAEVTEEVTAEQAEQPEAEQTEEITAEQVEQPEAEQTEEATAEQTEQPEAKQEEPPETEQKED